MSVSTVNFSLELNQKDIPYLEQSEDDFSGASSEEDDTFVVDDSDEDGEPATGKDTHVSIEFFHCPEMRC